MSYHPHIPHALKMELCERQDWKCVCGKCGGKPLLYGRTIFDHRPPLMHREFDPVTKLYTPDANDLRYLQAITSECSDVLTFGKGGEKRITTRDSDIGEKAREDSISGNFADHKTYMANKVPGQPRPLKNTFGRRPLTQAKRNPP